MSTTGPGVTDTLTAEMEKTNLPGAARVSLIPEAVTCSRAPEMVLTGLHSLHLDGV